MKLEELSSEELSEMSMIEIAHAYLEEKNAVVDFNDLMVIVGEYLHLSDEQMAREMSRFYTTLNTDGAFISLGENRWGLRSWYAIDEIDEEIVSSMDEDELQHKRRKKGKKKFNAFSDDDDAIDYSDDDDEDIDYDEEDGDEDEPEALHSAGDDDDEEETDELKAYKTDLSEFDDSDVDDETLEGHLTIIEDDQLEEDEEEED